MKKDKNTENEDSKKIEEYPGVRFDKENQKFIATFKKNSVVHVATKNTFQEAKSAMIEFKK